MPERKRISVIIPTLDEEKVLPKTLKALEMQEGWDEAWIVDGGSTDRTVDIAAAFAERDARIRCIHAARGRGSQLNAGAEQATGDVLLFLHADTQPAYGCFRTLQSALADGCVRAGCFTHRFSRADFSLNLLSELHNRRFIITQVAYGDQALFVERDLFREAGGFPDAPLEDIRFGEKLRQLTWPMQVEGVVVTDSRKFRQLGTWRSMLHIAGILAADKIGRLPRSPFLRNIR